MTTETRDYLLPPFGLVRPLQAISGTSPSPTDEQSTEVCFEVSVASESLLAALLLEQLSRRWPGEVIVTEDLDSRGANSPAFSVRNLTNRRSLVLFVNPPELAVLGPLLAGGDVSILTLDASAQELERALVAIESGEAPVISFALASKLLVGKDPTGPLLTPREREIVGLVMRGYSNREVADALVISTNTVRTHLHTISERLKVSSRGKLVVRARELGIA